MSTQNLIKDFIDKTKNSSSEKFALGIVTTSYNFNESYFSFPRKISNWGYYFHVVCSTSEVASKLIEDLEGYIDEFLLDMEPKKSDFNFVDIKNNNSNIMFKSIYPNNITVRSCIDFINKNDYQSIFIFGHGNIAFHLTNALKDSNISLSWVSSRESSSKKYKRMKSNFSELEDNISNKENSLLINLSPYFTDFFLKLADYSHLDILDVAGKSAFKKSIKNNIYILDISSRLVNEISYILTGNVYSESYGSFTDSKNNTYVSGGYNAKSGDIIVDDYRNPSFVIGISDGDGGFSRRINKIFSDNLLNNFD